MNTVRQLKHSTPGFVSPCVPVQPLALSYSGTSNFNPSTSGQGASPAGPTILVVRYGFLGNALMDVLCAE